MADWEHRAFDRTCLLAVTHYFEHCAFNLPSLSLCSKRLKEPCLICIFERNRNKKVNAKHSFSTSNVVCFEFGILGHTHKHESKRSSVTTNRDETNGHFKIGKFVISLVKSSPLDIGTYGLRRVLDSGAPRRTKDWNANDTRT